jgi:hypothetical protein
VSSSAPRSRLTRALVGVGLALAVGALSGLAFMFSLISCGAENVTDSDYLKVCRAFGAAEGLIFVVGVIGPMALLIGNAAAGVSLRTSAQLGAAVVLLWMLYIAALFITWNT